MKFLRLGSEERASRKKKKSREENSTEVNKLERNGSTRGSFRSFFGKKKSNEGISHAELVHTTYQGNFETLENFETSGTIKQSNGSSAKKEPARPKQDVVVRTAEVNEKDIDALKTLMSELTDENENVLALVNLSPPSPGQPKTPATTPRVRNFSQSQTFENKAVLLDKNLLKEKLSMLEHNYQINKDSNGDHSNDRGWVEEECISDSVVYEDHRSPDALSPPLDELQHHASTDSLLHEVDSFTEVNVSQDLERTFSVSDKTKIMEYTATGQLSPDKSNVVKNYTISPDVKARKVEFVDESHKVSYFLIKTVHSHIAAVNKELINTNETQSDAVFEKVIDTYRKLNDSELDLEKVLGVEHSEQNGHSNETHTFSVQFNSPDGHANKTHTSLSQVDSPVCQSPMSEVAKETIIPQDEIKPKTNGEEVHEYASNLTSDIMDNVKGQLRESFDEATPVEDEMVLEVEQPIEESSLSKSNDIGFCLVDVDSNRREDQGNTFSASIEEVVKDEREDSSPNNIDDSSYSIKPPRVIVEEEGLCANSIAVDESIEDSLFDKLLEVEEKDVKLPPLKGKETEKEVVVESNSIAADVEDEQCSPNRMQYNKAIDAAIHRRDERIKQLLAEEIKAQEQKETEASEMHIEEEEEEEEEEQSRNEEALNQDQDEAPLRKELLVEQLLRKMAKMSKDSNRSNESIATEIKKELKFRRESVIKAAIQRSSREEGTRDRYYNEEARKISNIASVLLRVYRDGSNSQEVIPERAAKALQIAEEDIPCESVSQEKTQLLAPWMDESCSEEKAEKPSQTEDCSRNRSESSESDPQNPMRRKSSLYRKRPSIDVIPVGAISLHHQVRRSIDLDSGITKPTSQAGLQSADDEEKSPHLVSKSISYLSHVRKPLSSHEDEIFTISMESGADKSAVKCESGQSVTLKTNNQPMKVVTVKPWKEAEDITLNINGTEKRDDRIEVKLLSIVRPARVVTLELKSSGMIKHGLNHVQMSSTYNTVQEEEE